jgi:hypothetical protein
MEASSSLATTQGMSAFYWFFDCLFKKISDVTKKREKGRFAVTNNGSMIIRAKLPV